MRFASPPALFLLLTSVTVSATACRHKTPAPPVVTPASAPPSAPVATNEAPPPLAAKLGRAAIRHVIIVSEDGLRPDALMSVSAPVHEALMRRGSYSMKARTIRRASTLPSHAAMLS
ncbi:MAG TPA: hypothetical protein VK989_01005, partial [Polyangia bacterium]|nr:hypothetical protein [Polyangia bacterium]